MAPSVAVELLGLACDVDGSPNKNMSIRKDRSEEEKMEGRKDKAGKGERERMMK